MACARCGGFLVNEGWGGLIENFRERLLRTMRCVNCGSHRRFRDPRESSY